MRIVPDSNILISAFIWGGLPARLVESAILGNVELYVSQPIVEEILRVLRRKSFNELVIQEALPYIKANTSIVVTTQTLRVVLADPDDDKILECAVAATADFIVTGDKHLLRLDKYREILIVQVRELMERLELLN